MCSLRSAVCTSFAWHFIGGSLGVQPSLCGLYKLCMAFYRWQFGFATFTLRSAQALRQFLLSYFHCSEKVLPLQLNKKYFLNKKTLSLPLFCRVTQEGGSPSGSRTSTRKGPKGEGYRGETQRKSRNKKVKRYFCNVWKLKMIFYGLFTFWYVYSYNMFNCELKISIQQIKTNFVPEELKL